MTCPVGFAFQRRLGGLVLLQPVEVLEKEQPGGLLGVVEFGGAAALFPEGVVDILEGLFKHSGLCCGRECRSLYSTGINPLRTKLGSADLPDVWVWRREQESNLELVGSRVVEAVEAGPRSNRDRHQNPPPQRYCHATPSRSKSLPVRVEVPVLA